MDIEDYVAENYPEIIVEYNRYLTRHILPKVGSKVVTLRSGFGGGGGVIRVVDSVDEKYIHLSGGGYQYLCSLDDWYKSLVVLE